MLILPPASGHTHDALRVWYRFAGLNSLGFTLAFTVSLVYMVENVGLNPLQMVLVGTVLEIACFLFEVPTGIVADLYSRRLSVIIGSLLTGAGFIVQGSTPTFAAVLLAQILWGVGATFHSGAADAWLADEVGEGQAAKAYLRSAQVEQLAAFFGVILSVSIAVFNIQLAIIAGGLVHVLTGLYLLRYMPEAGFQPTAKQERETFRSMARTFGDGVRVIRASPTLITLAAITFIFGAFSESSDRLSTPHLLTSFVFPTINGAVLPSVIWFGVLEMIGLLFGASMLEFVRRRVKTDTSHHIARALIRVNGGMILLVLVFALSPNLALAIAALLFARTLRRVIHPLKTAWTNQGLDPRVRATVLSTVNQLDAVGQIGGGPVFGWIGTVWSLRAALSIGALVLSPALLLYARTLRLPDTRIAAETAPDDDRPVVGDAIPETV